MQRFIIKLLIENSTRILKSISNAYKEIIKTSAPKSANAYNKSKPDVFSNWSFTDMASHNQMSKSEALKILNFSENEKLTGKKIIERFEKYFELNDPLKGGSFYLQNKFFYAKEILIKDFPKEETISKFDNLTNDEYKKSSNKI